ncbi:hypothetical protein KAR02_10325, partial [Candidatus Bipolaricaulota bacterium]|nr:hypothetical protein [Candidatus Bipolaricaulota bacterium]
ELFAIDLYSVDPNALFGVAEETFEFPGYVIYDERQITVPLLLDSNSATSSEAGGSDNGPGW